MNSNLNSTNPKSKNFAILLEVDRPVAKLQDDIVNINYCDSEENRQCIQRQSMRQQSIRCVRDSIANFNLKRNVTAVTDRAAMAHNPENNSELKRREQGNINKEDKNKSSDNIDRRIGYKSQKYRSGQLSCCYSDIEAALEIAFADTGEKFSSLLTDGYAPLTPSREKTSLMAFSNLSKSAEIAKSAFLRIVRNYRLRSTLIGYRQCKLSTM